MEELNKTKMKIRSIKAIGKRPVYDISVNSENYNEQQYLLKNGVITHNTGIYYSANTIWILGRQQDKKGTEIQGYHFVINVEKSRFVKEKSKIPITVSWEGGIQKWSGLLDVALEGGYVTKPKNGWYMANDPKAGNAELHSSNCREVDTLQESFWKPIFEKTDFAEYVKNKFSIGLHEQPTTVDEQSFDDEVEDSPYI